jgi:Na+/H+ antiporter NhaA
MPALYIMPLVQVGNAGISLIEVAQEFFFTLSLAIRLTQIL